MRTTQTVLLSGVVLVAVVGFALSKDKSAPGSRRKLSAPRDEQAAASAATPKMATNFPVIGYIEKRGRTITIKAGPTGPVYSVKTADGKVLCENLSKEQLSAQAPELGEFLKTAVAGTPGAKSDARLNIRGDASLR
jgi:hypothetical protein